MNNLLREIEFELERERFRLFQEYAQVEHLNRTCKNRENYIKELCEQERKLKARKVKE